MYNVYIISGHMAGIDKGREPCITDEGGRDQVR